MPYFPDCSFLHLVIFVGMDFLSLHPLKQLNTFGISAYAKYFAVCTTVDDFKEAIEHNRNGANEELLILGGGSNVLFTKDFDGTVLKNNIGGIDLLREDSDYYYVKVGGGQNWHEFVMYCVANGYAGAENLSLIPGSVGAGPMQNIGAYGVELKDIFWELTALDVQTFELRYFTLNECVFDYRSSVFKTIYKNRYIITDVTFRLRKNPVFNVSYGAIEDELEKAGVQNLSIKAVSDAVIAIRRSKLPDPAEIGNAGSFFKNPSIVQEQFNALKAHYPNIPGYPSTENGKIKTAAGWLIEQCGWKGFRNGDYGVHKNQALVLVNYGNAHGNDIYGLSADIIKSVSEKYGITLEREVNVY